MDGILNISKPCGPTSFAVVARVKKLLNQPRVGHGGTLDPLASGVLPVFLGQATRVAEYLMEYPKTYRARIELGVSTDTYDAEGTVTNRCDAASITRPDVEAALSRFRGEILQKPPVYSAIKHEGQPLYKLARQGEPFEPSPRPASIYRLEMVTFESPRLTIEVECSKGTYIRSLAHDLGEALGCGAYLKSLVRTKYGPFDIEHAVTIERLEQALNESAWQPLIQPLDAVLALWEKVELTDEQVQAVRCGVWLALEATAGAARLRAYDNKGNLTALLSFETGKGLWRPNKVFRVESV